MNIISSSIEKIFNLEPMLRAKDLQKVFVNTSQSTFNSWVNLGLLHRYKIAGGVYYKLSEVEKLIENSREDKLVR